MIFAKCLADVAQALRDIRDRAGEVQGLSRFHFPCVRAEGKESRRARQVRKRGPKLPHFLRSLRRPLLRGDCHALAVIYQNTDNRRLAVRKLPVPCRLKEQAEHHEQCGKSQALQQPARRKRHTPRAIAVR